jgi:hypothetical protein
MAAYMIPIIAMIVLAVVVLGSVVLMRRGRSRSAEFSTGQGSTGFKDCYDLAAYGSEGEAPRSFTTMCASWPGA